MHDAPQPGVYIAFDFGTKRIGVAVGQTITQTAQPLATLTAKQGLPHWPDLLTLIQTWAPRGLIVGLPLQLDGSLTPTCHLAIHFAKQLSTRLPLPIYYIEERLTSVAADERIKTLKAYTKTQHSQDAFAAAIILESWFQQAPKDKTTCPYSIAN